MPIDPQEPKPVRATDPMSPEKKRVTVMLHDRITPRLLEVAVVLNLTPNKLVNRLIEGCLQQIDQPNKPFDPIPMVDLARTALRRNLSAGDRLLQKLLEKHIKGWAKKTQRWRELVVEEANLADEAELTIEAIQAARRRADKRWRAEVR